MAKLNIPKLQSSTFRGWAFVLVAGVLLTLVALISRGGVDLTPSTADGSTGCQLEVTVQDNDLNVRTGPAEDAPLATTLRNGERIDGTPVVTAGYRQLEDGLWAADRFLTPLPGTNCS